MGVLSQAVLALAVAAPACYSPTLADCTVSCASDTDCAGGQICGPAGLCAAVAVADRCTGHAPVDAPAPHVDASPADALETIALDVMIMGPGNIAIDGVGTCSSVPPQHGACTFAIDSGTTYAAHATAVVPDQVFDSWSSATCTGAPATCMFTPLAATTIAAKFKHQGPGP